MDKIVRYIVVICSILYCKGVEFRERADYDEEDVPVRIEISDNEDMVLGNNNRRFLDLTRAGHILGAPSDPSHLPEAEPILPGHTLIRPALGMLKSSVKFPHKDMDNGAGVYGNPDNLGIRYDGKNERVLYSGFRRTPENYIVISPMKSASQKPKFVVSSVVLDLDKNDVFSQNLRQIHESVKLKKEKREPKTKSRPHKSSILYCKGVEFRERADYDEEDVPVRIEISDNEDMVLGNNNRRFLDLTRAGHILGAPSDPSHLPEAEPILPGHTLIRPALGMLKSSVKFPHKDMDNGAGVYGNPDNLGIRYDGKNERVLYSGFRRTPENYIVISPMKSASQKPKFVVSSVVLDLDKNDVFSQNLRQIHESVKLKKEKREPKTKSRPHKSYRNKRFQSKGYNRLRLLVHGNPKGRLDTKALRNGQNKNSERSPSDLGYTSYEDIGNPPENNKTVEYSYSEESVEKPQRNYKWFWDAKSLFNPVKIHQEAPDQIELMPNNISTKMRNWWFYHQDDFRPFNSIKLTTA